MSNPVDPPVSADIEKCANALCPNHVDSGTMSIVHIPLKNSVRNILLTLCKPCAEALQRRLKEPS